MKNKNILLISVIILSIIGIIMITSSSIIWAEYKFDDPYKYMKSQILFFLISIILMFFISKINYKLYYKNVKKKTIQIGLFIKWCPVRDSNSRPFD